MQGCYKVNNYIMLQWKFGIMGGHKVAISRAFTGQFQRGCAIQENHGDDNFLSHKQGLSFCVRKMFVANQDST